MNKKCEGYCPKCGSDEIDYDMFDFDSKSQSAVCDKCGCHFFECYEMTYTHTEVDIMQK